MSAALVIRRKQVMCASGEGGRDPFGLTANNGKEGLGEKGVGGEKARAVLLAREEQARRDRSLLSLMSVLQKSQFWVQTLSVFLFFSEPGGVADTSLSTTGLATTNQGSVLTLLSSFPQLLENLRYVSSLSAPSPRSLILLFIATSLPDHPTRFYHSSTRFKF